MSKLRYAADDNSDEDEQGWTQPERIGAAATSSSSSSSGSSYELYDLRGDDDEEEGTRPAVNKVTTKPIKAITAPAPATAAPAPSSKKKNRKRKQQEMLDNDNDDDDEVTACAADSATATVTVAAAAARDRSEDDSSPTAHQSKRRRTSTWLSSFLSTKREVLAPDAPPEMDTFGDTFLREFNEQFQRQQQAQGSKEETVGVEGTDGQEDEEEESDEDVDDAALDMPIASSSSAMTVSASASSSCLVPPTTGKLQIWNLPFGINAEKVKSFGRQCGVEFTQVKLIVDPVRNQVGSAEVDLVAGVDTENAAKVLQAGSVSGRPVRVSVTRSSTERGAEALAADQLRRRSNAAESRYFGSISVKCNNCGGVGHKAATCTEAALVNPCHLCAGKDHDASDCPNITCFRCGEFGHHSKNCTNNRRYSRLAVCSRCASTTHDVRQCSADVDRANARMEDDTTRCMACNAIGHALCKRMTAGGSIKAGMVYCPNCGKPGHHVDYPADHLAQCVEGSNSSSSSSNRVPAAYLSTAPNPCQTPKQDAYNKYPLLLRYINSYPSELGYRSAPQWYQSLLKGAGSQSAAAQEQMMAMFPCLCKVSLRSRQDQDAGSGFGSGLGRGGGSGSGSGSGSGKGGGKGQAKGSGKGAAGLPWGGVPVGPLQMKLRDRSTLSRPTGAGAGADGGMQYDSHDPYAHQHQQQQQYQSQHQHQHSYPAYTGPSASAVGTGAGAGAGSWFQQFQQPLQLPASQPPQTHRRFPPSASASVVTSSHTSLTNYSRSVAKQTPAPVTYGRAPPAYQGGGGHNNGEAFSQIRERVSGFVTNSQYPGQGQGQGYGQGHSQGYSLSSSSSSSSSSGGRGQYDDRSSSRAGYTSYSSSHGSSSHSSSSHSSSHSSSGSGGHNNSRNQGQGQGQGQGQDARRVVRR
jgi:hypothetical protein